MPCVNSLESGLLQKEHRDDYEGILGGVHVVVRLWPSRAAPCLSAILLPCSSKNTPGSRGSLCSRGSALGSAPSSSTSHRAFALASALHQPNLPARELGSSFRTPSCHEGRWIRAAPSPPGAAQGERGAAQHIWSSWKGRASTGFHAPAGCGWSA